MVDKGAQFWQRLPRKVILCGGTFDPVQIAHCEMVRRAFAEPGFGDAAVVFVPAGRNPLKPVGPEASNEDRISMLHAAIGELFVGMPCFLSPIECDRGSQTPSYTSITVQEVRTMLLPQQQLFLLMGGDSACSFPRWHQPEVILTHISGMLVMPRSENDRIAITELRTTFSPSLRQKFADIIIAGDLLAASASEVRERIGRGESVTGLVPASVLDYIRARRLYCA